MSEHHAHDGPPEAVGPVKHWELLTVFVLLLGVFAMRQTGSLPGQTIRVLDLLFVATSLALAMRAAGVGRRTRIVHGAIAGASIVIGVIGVSTSSLAGQRAASLLSAYLLGAAFVFIVRVVLRQRHVTGDTVFGALAAYVAVATIFAMVYTVIARTDPGAFEPPQPVADGQTDLYYFSFVTITSLGYGDISPASDLVRVLAPVEAVIGAIMIAALVGRLVGLLVAQTAATGTLGRLDALTRAVERLDRDRRDPDPGPD